ncbi:LOW QUALITY PROTEIN: hypothetical protein OSB04_un000610 [Centaurea solstitialis]|uniref:DUF4371 domain-containing protein n=1 Tax=Centaurea solstitialis TaxID=347529 RepID=A0AA38W3G1_9ASTR|nr:LOW QUALITY PROTEIN: hypothetical protein OSB04_un000610 [Centaurea solstitialis]
MTCSSIQKDIVHATKLKLLKKEIRDNFFVILVDESRDVFCKEQMALVLRFVNDEGIVVERFNGIKHVDDTSSLSLKATIYSMFLEYELSFSKIRGQHYDRASNMRGAFNGLKTMIMKDVQSAYYIHCFAHQLQLTLFFVAKNQHHINDFFELISQLLNMIGSSYKRRDKLRDKQETRVVATLANKFGTGLNQKTGIKRPSDARWGSHYGSLLNIKTLYHSICELLEDIMEYANCQGHRSQVRCMLKAILIFDCVFCLHLIVDILGITNKLNTTLQRKDQDIINAMHQVRSQKKDCKKRGMKDRNHS